MSSALQQVKAKAEAQSTEVLVIAVLELQAKAQREEHERLTYAALCDVIEEREGLDFLSAVLDEELAA